MTTPIGIDEIRAAAAGAAAAEAPNAKPALGDMVMPMPDFQRLDIPPRRAYLAPWLREGSICMISGGRGDGKTMFVMSLLGATAKASGFGPWQCSEPTKGCIVDGEMPAQDTIERAAMLGVADTPNLYIYSDAWASQNGFPRANLVDPEWREKIKAVLIDKRIEIVAFDNLASLAPGLDENARKDWDPVNQFLLDLRFRGVSSILLHHTGKGGSQRGTSAREDNLDCSILISRPPDYVSEEGARFICRFTKSRVAHDDLHLIQDTEFRLSVDEYGQYVWTWRAVRQQTRVSILELLSQGVKQAEVAEILSVSKGQVSKVRAKAIKEGVMTEKNVLTVDGLAILEKGVF